MRQELLEALYVPVVSRFSIQQLFQRQTLILGDHCACQLPQALCHMRSASDLLVMPSGDRGETDSKHQKDLSVGRLTGSVGRAGDS